MKSWTAESIDETRTWACSCATHAAPRRRRSAADALLVGLQCLRCGSWKIQRRGQYEQREIDRLQWYDESLARRWREAQSVASRAKYEEEQLEREEEEKRLKRERWARYNKYLNTNQWKQLRAKVLLRSGGICEACLSERATEVHHITYEHIFEEPCFDLRAVCSPCHERITVRDRTNRERPAP